MPWYSNKFQLFLKRKKHKNAFQYHSAIWGVFFQKTSITYNLGKKCWDKKEFFFFQWKTPFPLNQCYLQSFRLLTKKLDQFQHWYKGKRGRICNLKNWDSSWIYWIFNFSLNKFYLGFYLMCALTLSHMKDNPMKSLRPSLATYRLSGRKLARSIRAL